jgi:hypothetical protein
VSYKEKKKIRATPPRATERGKNKNNAGRAGEDEELLLSLPSLLLFVLVGNMNMQ